MVEIFQWAHQHWHQYWHQLMVISYCLILSVSLSPRVITLSGLCHPLQVDTFLWATVGQNYTTETPTFSPDQYCQWVKPLS